MVNEGYMRFLKILMTFVLLLFLISCDLLSPKTEYGKVKGHVLFEHSQPAANVEVLLGRTEYTWGGHPGSWTTERSVETDTAGFFKFKNIESQTWAVKIALDDPILEEYEVSPVSHIVEVKENKTSEIEFILID